MLDKHPFLKTIFFSLLIVIAIVMPSEDMEQYYTKNETSEIYCQLNGNCTLSNLVVLGNTTNLTINQQTLNITQTITLNGSSIDDWSDISTLINNTDLWTNESGVATYYGNVEAKGNVTLDEKINMAQNAQIFIDETGCINFVAGNGK